MSDEWTAPPSPQDFQGPSRDGLREMLALIERQRRELADMRNNLLNTAGISVEPDTLVVNRNLSMREGANLEVNDGGRLRVKYPADLGGQNAVYFGRASSDLDGSYTGTGLLVERPDGNDMLNVRTDATGDRHQIIARDNSDNVVLWVDSERPRGLSRPQWTIPGSPADYTLWSGTQSSTWARLAEGFGRLYHSGIWVNCKVTTDVSGTTGEVRATIFHPASGGEFQIDATKTVGFSIDFRDFIGPMPAEVGIGDVFYVRLEGRRTAGTGNIRGTMLGAAMQTG